MSKLPVEFNLEARSPFDGIFDISKDATLPALELQLFNGAGTVNLTGAAGTFIMDTEAGVNKVDKAATFPDAVDGKMKYEWAATDTNTEGKFFGQFIVTIGSRKYRIPNNQSQRLVINVGPRIN